MKKFNKLYKLTSTGAIQEWEISVNGSTIITKFGQVGGLIQTATDVITEGKNIGKSNETTAEEQALAEAQSKWEKKKKANAYVETINLAKSETADDLVEGGILPMLAQKYSERASKIKFPAYCQPKLDGSRLIAMVKNGKCTLWSRTRKAVTGVPHIARELERLFPIEEVVLDGECYNHSLKKDFEKIMHFVRQETPEPGHEIVEYHVYDVITKGTFKERYAVLAKSKIAAKASKSVVLVDTRIVKDEEELMDCFSEFLEAGYEGCMARNGDSLYENKRSNGLQKIKEMQDAEFRIIGVEEGRGKMFGKAIFRCITKNGDEFSVKMKGKLEDLEIYVKNPDLAIDKNLTVQFQNMSAYGIPRFPVGLRIRIEGY